MHPFSYPFNPVVLIPPTKYFDPQKYNTIGGIIIKVEAAIIDGQLMTNAFPAVYINVVIRAIVRVLHVSLLI